MGVQINQTGSLRRDDICLYVSPANRAQLEAIIKDRNSSHKAVWRAQIVLITAEGHGTNEIMRRTGKSKPCIWRWQERYIDEGVDGLLRDKTRPSRVPPLSEDVKLTVLKKTASETPENATHWSRAQRLTKAAELVESAVHETITYYHFPEAHWRRIRTNNPLERILREIRRRTKVVGAFPDGNSALNLAAARLRHISGTGWATKRYLNMELLKDQKMRRTTA
jgi:transposase